MTADLKALCRRFISAVDKEVVPREVWLSGFVDSFVEQARPLCAEGALVIERLDGSQSLVDELQGVGEVHNKRLSDLVAKINELVDHANEHSFPEAGKREEEAMEKIRLETLVGGFVCTGEIPPFNELPKVILWGTRVFHLHEEKKPGEKSVYREVFTVACVKWDFAE